MNKNLKLPILGLLLILTVVNCPTPPTPGDLLNKRIIENFDENKTLAVNFVTTRREKQGVTPACDSNFYGLLNDINSHYGECILNIPAKHSIGDITWDNSLDKNTYFQLIGKNDKKAEDFYNKLGASSFDEVLVFVHGFNVNFDEAVIRAGQIKYDLKFPGEVVVYSWPAGSEAGVLNSLMVKSTYETNFNEAKLSRDPFALFLSNLVSIKKKIHLVVHSMGHQVVLPALAKEAKSGKKKFIDQLILNAPDFDKAEFAAIAPFLIDASNRITLYCSPGDNALIASQKVNGGSRAGMCHRFNGIDVINVNEVDSPVFGIAGLGHGYYSSRPLLTDIYQVILGINVEKRLFIRKAGVGNGENFILRK